MQHKKILSVVTLALLLVGAGCNNSAATTVSGDDSTIVPVENILNAQNVIMPQQTAPAPSSTPTTPVEIAPLSLNQKLTFTKPSMQIDATKKYSAVLHTSAGDITIEFNAKATPITVNNFVSLARSGFYNNTIFHRIIKGFMIQGGDPVGNGTGGPGYRFDDEPFTGEYTRGTVAMANAGPNTNGSQFFIMHADQPLPKNYVIFGHVTSGMNVVDAIASAAVQPYGEGSTPVSPVTVTSVDVSEK